MGKTSNNIYMVTDLQSLIADRNPDLHAMLHDTKRFILSYQSIVGKAPLQLYSATLVFSLRSSAVRRQFIHEFPRWIARLPKVEKDWGPALQTLEGHRDWVKALAFSPDGQLLASGSGDKTLRLWNVRTGMLSSILEGHSGSVNEVTFSPDGRFLASASEVEALLWDVRTGALESKLACHSDRVNAMAFSPDNRRLACASDTIGLWDVRTGALSSLLESQSKDIRTVVFSPSGRLLASAHGGTIGLWDTETGVLIDTINCYPGFVVTMTFSVDGELLASTWDKSRSTMSHWDIGIAASGSALMDRLWTAQKDFKPRIIFRYSGEISGNISPDNRLFASIDLRTIQLWDTDTGALRCTLEGHCDLVLGVIFSPDGQLVASAACDDTVRIWDTHIGAPGGIIEDDSTNTGLHGEILAKSSGDNAECLLINWTGDERLKPPGSIEQLPLSIFGRRVINKHHGHHKDSHGKQYPITDRSKLDLYYKSYFSIEPQSSPSSSRHDSHRRPLSSVLSSLRVEKGWVQWRSKNILWLPPQYRRTWFVVRDNVMGIGHSSGRIHFIEFDLENLPLSLDTPHSETEDSDANECETKDSDWGECETEDSDASECERRDARSCACRSRVIYDPGFSRVVDWKSIYSETFRIVD